MKLKLDAPVAGYYDWAAGGCAALRLRPEKRAVGGAVNCDYCDGC